MSESSLGLFGIHGQALVYRQERLNLIAGNLANADTPHFRAQDIDFQSALRAAVSKDAVGEALSRTQAAHLDASGNSNGDIASLRIYRTPLQPSLDGNTVDASIEQASFGRAALEYRASLSFIEGRIRSLLTAITGD